MATRRSTGGSTVSEGACRCHVKSPNHSAHTACAVCGVTRMASTHLITLGPCSRDGLALRDGAVHQAVQEV